MAFINKVINKEKKVFWAVFVVIAAVLLAVVLFASTERPVGRASGCYDGLPGGGTIDKNGWCCPPSWSKAPCFNVNDRISPSDELLPLIDGEILSEGDWNRIADFEGEYDNYYLDLVADNQNISKEGLRVGEIPKEDPTDCKQNHANCIAAGTDRSECDKDFNCPTGNGGPGTGDNKGGTGGKDKSGLGNDCLLACKDKDGRDLTIPCNKPDGTKNICPKKDGSGSDGGGKVCVLQGGAEPSCPGGVKPVWDQDACKFVCRGGGFLPPTDECQPNSKNIKCIFWRIFEPWLS